MNNKNMAIPIRNVKKRFENFEVNYVLYLTRDACCVDKEITLSPLCEHNEYYSLFLSIYDTEYKKYEESFFNDISRSKTTANNIFDLLSQGLVTPTTIDEVMSDLLYEG